MLAKSNPQMPPTKTNGANYGIRQFCIHTSCGRQLCIARHKKVLKLFGGGEGVSGPCGSTPDCYQVTMLFMLINTFAP